MHALSSGPGCFNYEMKHAELGCMGTGLIFLTDVSVNKAFLRLSRLILNVEERK
jgi:hypothetical protein